MVFLLFFLTIILISMVFVFSKIKIQIINLKFCSQSKRHLNKDYQIVMKFCILGSIPIFKIHITKAKLEKIKLKERVKNINFELLEKNLSFDKDIWQAVKQLHLSINRMNLQISIGTQNASLTAMIVPTVSTILAMLLRKNVKKYEKQIWMVNPVYQNQNLVNIYFSGIFEVKMRHIINVIYIFNKKGVKKHERTSNRRSYDYSYE